MRLPRVHLFEIGDQTWMPDAIRRDFNRLMRLQADSIYSILLPELEALLKRTDSRQVLDLCSGGGGPWPGFCRKLDPAKGPPTSVMLSDRFPKPESLHACGAAAGTRLVYHPEAVDARNVPGQLRGLRTMFTSFHHFRPDQARAILQDAVRHRTGIAIFEFTAREAKNLMRMLVSPWHVWKNTARLKPLAWQTVAWTYLIPLIPLINFWDGVVSHLRSYTPTELMEMAAAVNASDYLWDCGVVPSGVKGIEITFLTGIPAEANEPGKR